MVERWKNNKTNGLPPSYYNYNNRTNSAMHSSQQNNWQKEPKYYGDPPHSRRFKLLWQCVASTLIFALVIGMFQSGNPALGEMKGVVRAWFTVDADLTSVTKMFSNLTLTEDSFDKAGYAVVKANAAVAQIHEDMVIPVAGKVISSFGWQPTAANKGFNQGITIETAAREQVKAAYAGTVLVVQKDESGEFTIMLAHANGLVTTYGRCSQVYVKADQVVEKGQVIGVAGKTSVEKGQIYFETKHLGEPIDPLVLLQGKEV